MGGNGLPGLARMLKYDNTNWTGLKDVPYFLLWMALCSIQVGVVISFAELRVFILYTSQRASVLPLVNYNLCDGKHEQFIKYTQ